eukprot:1738526-Pyramimonas_sp.AAC.2
MITDHSVLATVAEEQRGHLPTWGHPRDSDIAETYDLPLCSTDEDYTYGLDSNENGQFTSGTCVSRLMQKTERAFEAGRQRDCRIRDGEGKAGVAPPGRA